MKKHFVSLLIGIVAYVQVSNVYAQKTVYSKDVEQQIKQVETNLFSNKPGSNNDKWAIDTRMRHYGVYGLSVAVIKDYKIEWVKGYGFADFEEERPLTTETLFRQRLSVNP